MEAPLIAVTASGQGDARPYVESLEKRGARAVLLVPGSEVNESDPVRGATALMLTGGEDVSPALYGQPAEPGIDLEIDRRRDETELALLTHALHHDLPVYAICRGVQLLNVAFGGSLLQDLPGHRGEERDDGEWDTVHHMVYISPGSKLAVIMGSGGFMRLNSAHHQGLREAQKSPRLLGVAYSLGDGIIEGLESPAHDWVIGVQCHPEREREVPGAFRRVFQAFVERAAMSAGRLQRP